MDTSSPEYTIVHRALEDSLPDYNLMLLRKGNEYCVLYEYVIREDTHIPLRRWYSIDDLVRLGIRYLDVSLDSFIEMAGFIREYVGEARWILAVLANT